MNRIENVTTWEDWQAIHCKGEFEVTAQKLIVQFWETGFVIYLAQEAGKKGSKLPKYFINADLCTLMNWMHEAGHSYDLEWLAAQVGPNGICYQDNDYEGLGFLSENIRVYRYIVNGKDFRPSWWKPSGKQKLVYVDCGEFLAKICTNHSIKIERKDGTPVKVFSLGDTVEQGSYNMVYTGEIIDIKEKYIEVSGCPLDTTRMSIEKFVWRNHDLDLKAIGERNAAWSD